MLYQLLGFLFLGLGILGIPLPILPTTPFLLLAAGCFAKSSPRLHQWLLNHRIFGSIIRDWEDKQCLAKHTKLMAMGTSAGFGGLSVIWLLPHWSAKVICAALLLYGLFFIWRLPTCTKD